MKIGKKLAAASLVAVFSVNQSFSAFAATFTVSNPVLISQSVKNGTVTARIKGVINASPSSFCLGLTEFLIIKRFLMRCVKRKDYEKRVRNSGIVIYFNMDMCQL